MRAFLRGRLIALLSLANIRRTAADCASQDCRNTPYVAHGMLGFRRAICCCTLAIALSVTVVITSQNSSEAQTTTTTLERWGALTPASWRADLQYFVTMANDRHRFLFHTMTRAQFEEAVRLLDARIPTSSPSSIFDGFVRLAALIQDSHSGVAITDMQLPEVPARFRRFADGLFVVAASPQQAAIVGSRVVRIGSVETSAALERLFPLLPREAGNSGQPFVLGPQNYVNVPIVLSGLGLSDSTDEATYVLEKNGRRRTVVLRAVARRPPGSVRDLILDPLPAGWASAGPSEAVPLSRQHSDSFYFFTPVPAHAAVYVCFRGVLDDPERSLASFSQSLGTYLAAHPGDRAIVDLRANGGGDNTLLQPLLLSLIRSPQNHRGGLWVLISPVTHSAAQTFVDRLANFTSPIFVGEPTGEPVNFYGDPTEITLPNSGIPIALSTLWWQDGDPRDVQQATYPEIASEVTFADYMAGLDPTLDLALSLAVPPRLGDVLTRAAPSGTEAVFAAYRSYVSDRRHRFMRDAERQVNAAGYQLLSEHAAARAVSVFRLNVVEHPTSSNAYDSLADGLEAIGDARGSSAARKRSIALKKGAPDTVGAAPR